MVFSEITGWSGSIGRMLLWLLEVGGGGSRGWLPPSVSFFTCGPLSSLVPPGWSTPITAASGFVGWASWAKLEGGVAQRLRCSSRAEQFRQVDRGRTWHPGHRNSPDKSRVSITPARHAPSHTEAHHAPVLLSLAGGSIELGGTNRVVPIGWFWNLPYGDCPRRPHFQLQRKASKNGTHPKWSAVCASVLSHHGVRGSLWPLDCRPPGSSVHRTSQARTRVGWHSLFQGDLPDPGIKPMSPASPAALGRFFTPEPPGSLVCPLKALRWV